VLFSAASGTERRRTEVVKAMITYLVVAGIAAVVLVGFVVLAIVTFTWD